MKEEFKKKYWGKNQIKNKFPDEYKKIENFNVNFNGIKWGQKLYNYINDIQSHPICICGNCVKFIKFGKGYNKYCSSKCRYNDENLKNKIKDSFINKYGVDNPLKSEKIKEKRKLNFIEKYGVEHQSQIEFIKEKKRKTNLEKYGYTTNLLHVDTKNKAIKTCKEKYGVNHNSQSKIIKERKKQLCLSKHNVENYFQTIEFKKKSKNTCLCKFGVEHTSKSEEIRNKQLKTKKKNILKKYSDLLELNEKNLEIKDNLLKIRNYCIIHNEFEISINNLHQRWYKYNKNICTKCNPISENSSIKENEIRDFINNELNLYTEKFYVNNKEIDIYLPEHKLGIEFNGLYWHSSIYKEKNYHLNKTEECENNGIQLLHIFEDEWINKKEIVKSIIKSKLNIFDRKIYARKCEIKEINDNKLIRKFLNENHLQGFIGAKYKIGLFYENELVSLMTFGKLRKALGNKNNSSDEYEMLRFCNKHNTQIIGGASKLLKYFIRNYHPKSILTFADRRYSNGNLYKKLGFNFEKITQPNYWYFKTHEYKRYHRYTFRKDVLIKEGYDSNKTELEIMSERGYNSIYDCGNIKYLFQL